MAKVEISHDEESVAKELLGAAAKQTGRLRWWVDGAGEKRLQTEWASSVTRSAIWVDVPTITHVAE